MSASTLKIGVVAMAMSAALLSHVATAEAQLGSIVKRAAAKPPQPAAQPPQATAGKQLRVKLSLEVTGSYQHTGPKVIPKGSIYLPVKLALNNSYTTEYIVGPETILTGLQKTNPLDPASQKEMDDYNAKVKAQADRVYHSADNLRKPGTAGSARPGMSPAMMDPAAMQAMMAKVQACGQDKACQQKAAMEMMSQQMPSGQAAQAQAVIQEMSNVCINEKRQKMGTKGYEQCMDAEGEKRSTVKRSAADNEPEVPELPDRYLPYSNITESNRFTDCQFKAHARVNDSFTLGGISDGEGGGKYFETSGADKGEADAASQTPQPCVLTNAVFDPKTNLFWMPLSLVRVDAKAVRTGAFTGVGGGVEPSPEIDQWVAATLLGAPASGTKTQTFGFQTAKFTWSITRE